MPSMKRFAEVLSENSGIEYFDSRTIRKLFRLSSMELYDLRRLGFFPEPDLKLGYRTHLWKRETIAEWVKGYPTAENNKEGGRA